MIMFPSEYPFKPPGIKMLTPSGRFQPDKKICFSMSDFHPGSWNPAWSVATMCGVPIVLVMCTVPDVSLVQLNGSALLYAF